MLRRLLRILLPSGLVLGLVLLVRRTMSLRDELGAPSPDPWTPIPAQPAPPVPPVAPWLPANEDGSCPPTHPIKVKVASGLYHLPGMFAYERTKPDRCYAEESAAAAAGFTKAKR